MSDLRRLFSYFGRYRRDLVFAFLLVAIETSFELFIPVMMADLVDYGVMQRDIGYMVEKGVQMGFCAILALITGLLYARFAARAAYGWSAEIREAEYRRLQTFSFADIDRFETSSLVTRLTSDATVLQNAVNGGLRPLVRSPILLILGIVLSFSLDPELALIFVVLAPVLAIILFLILRRVAPMYSLLQKAIDKLNSAVEENVRAIRTVKAFVREDYEECHFDEANSNQRNIGIETNKFAMLNMPSFQLVMYTAIIMIMWFGGERMLASDLEVGALTGILSYVMNILNSLMMISNVFMLLTRSLASAHRVAEVLDTIPSLQERADAADEIRDGSIDFSHVSFRYSGSAGEYTLSDITFRIESGMTVGILGGTGSGKTTLVQLIPRLYDASSGVVSVGGRDVREYTLEGLRRHIGIVLQKNMLFSGSIRENMRWGGPSAADDEIWAALKIAAADDFVRSFPGGLDYDLGQGGVNVSGGQKQRLSIARALLTEPKILIFDDSLSAVDTATEHRIMKGLSAIKGVTKIFIAERISSVINADMIIVLDDGRIESIGDNETLMKTSRVYREIYEAQLKGGRDATSPVHG